MIESRILFPGITLRCIRDDRFKHACLSVQLVRPMCREEAAMNALLPSVLLRGCESCRDLRAITLRLDDLYGAGLGPMVRRAGDYQTTGLYASFIEDRFAMEGDAVLQPMVDFVRQLLLEPVTENGVFSEKYVEGEKKNLISTIEAQRNDKRAYAMEQMLKRMCREDSYGISRLGEVEQVAEITAKSLFAHYLRILQQSRIEVFYVGAAQIDTVENHVKTVFAGLERDYVNLKPHTPFHSCPGSTHTEQMRISQGKLCMGFTTPVTVFNGGFAAMQVLNAIFGGGMTSKLFTHIREEMSLCYAIGSSYFSAKGLMTVSAGIDSNMAELVQQHILHQLDACCRGEISQQELLSAKQEICTSLLAIHDSPTAMENYYSGNTLTGIDTDVHAQIRAIQAVTAEQVAAAAATVKLHTVYFLKGVTA